MGLETISPLLTGMQQPGPYRAGPMGAQGGFLQPGEGMSPEMQARVQAGQHGPARAGQAGIAGLPSGGQQMPPGSMGK